MVSDRRSQIIKTAAKLFSDRGYKNVTTKKIAENCGITEAALYKHFDSKNNIYTEVLRSLQGDIKVDNLLRKLDLEQDIEIILSSIAGHIIDSYQKHQKILRLLLYTSLEKHTLCEEIYDSMRMPYINFLEAKIDSLIKSGKIREVNPSITARCFVGMVFDCSLNLCLWKGFSGRKFDPDATIKNNASIFARGLKINDNRMPGPVG